MKTIALILAGGIGKRFSPLTTSKPLFHFLSKPLIEHQLISLRKAGFLKAVIVSSKKDENEISKIKIKGLKTKIVVQSHASGMADAVLASQEHIKDSSVLIINSSDLVEDNLFKEILQKKVGKSNNFIIAKKQKEYFSGGYLTFKKNKLSGIIEKPEENNQPSNLLNLVFHYFVSANEFLEVLKSATSQDDDVYEKALTNFIKTNHVDVETYDGTWIPLKYPWHILDMNKYFLTNQGNFPNNAQEIASSAIIDKNVQIEKGARILENAVIKGPSYIGENTVIGTNSLVIEAMIGKNCVIGFTSEVTRSYLGNRTWLHHNYIGDSVLEGNHFFGNGVVTANFRLDAGEIHSTLREQRINTKRKKFGVVVAKGTNIGVNASLMPGVKVGASATIGPGEIVYKDIKSKEKYYTGR